jgi:hypothetical protein
MHTMVYGPGQDPTTHACTLQALDGSDGKGQSAAEKQLRVWQVCVLVCLRVRAHTCVCVCVSVCV